MAITKILVTLTHGIPVLGFMMGLFYYIVNFIRFAIKAYFLFTFTLFGESASMSISSSLSLELTDEQVDTVLSRMRKINTNHSVT